MNIKKGMMFRKFSIINDRKIIDVDLRVWYTVIVYSADEGES
jgi:hypothetical protein